MNSKFFDLFILQKKSWWEKCWYCSTSTNSLVFEMNLFWSWKSLLNNFYEIFKSKSFLNWFVLFDSTLGLLTNLLMICLVNCLDIKGLLINHLIIDGMFSCLYIKELLINLIKWTLQFLQVKRLYSSTTRKSKTYI